MFKVMIRTFLVVLVLSSGAALRAQDGISAEKKSLINELLTVTEATKNSEAIMNAMSAQVQKDMLEIFSQMISTDTSIPAAQRPLVQQLVAESAQRSARRFKELFNQRINYAQMVEEVSYQVYDKYYTTEELKDLVAFYRTPTGQKTIKVMPQLFSESMSLTSARLMPLVQPLMREVMDEEMKKLEALVPRRAAQRRRR